MWKLPLEATGVGKKKKNYRRRRKRLVEKTADEKGVLEAQGDNEPQVHGNNQCQILQAQELEQRKGHCI